MQTKVAQLESLRSRLSSYSYPLQDWLLESTSNKLKRLKNKDQQPFVLPTAPLVNIESEHQAAVPNTSSSALTDGEF